MSSHQASRKSLELWIRDAACTIRGVKGASKYMDHNLPDIFAKGLCDVFDDEINRIPKPIRSRKEGARTRKSAIWGNCSGLENPLSFKPPRAGKHTRNLRDALHEHDHPREGGTNRDRRHVQAPKLRDKSSNLRTFDRVVAITRRDRALVKAEGKMQSEQSGQNKLRRLPAKVRFRRITNNLLHEMMTTKTRVHEMSIPATS